MPDSMLIVVDLKEADEDFKECRCIFHGESLSYSCVRCKLLTGGSNGQSK
jgi:hypothetical protein